MDPNQISNLIDAIVNVSNRETSPVRHYQSENYESIFVLDNLIDNTAIPSRFERHCCRTIRFQHLYCIGCFTVLKFVSYCAHILPDDDFFPATRCYDCRFNSSRMLTIPEKCLQSYWEE